MIIRWSFATAHVLRATLLLAGFSTACPAAAQTTTPASAGTAPGKVYTYVEQMPQLAGGGGNRAIVEAIQRQVKYPAAALKSKVEGAVFVNFIVDESGQVRDAKVVKGIGSGCDEAVLAAVQQLPQFIPGRQQGKPVAVSFTVPVTFRTQAAGPGRRP